MMLKIRNWCEELIVAIILCIIIECLIPVGKNKKYVKTIIGIFIMFISISPILEIFDYGIDFEEMFGVKFEETYNSLDYDLKDVYIIGIEESIKKEIVGLGYKVRNIDIVLDYNYENIKQINIEMLEVKNDDNYQNILNMLKEKYFVEEKDVFIK